MPALARGSTLVEGAPEKAATLLLDFPAAPYTAFLVDETGCARCFQQHCLRLANGLHELNLWSRYNGETGTVVRIGHTVTVSDIEQKALPAIKLAVSTCRAQQRMAAPAMVTLIADNRCKEENWLLAHAAPLPSQDSSKSLNVVCAAPPRVLPFVKHTQWIHTRQRYMQLLPDLASEGLICSSDGDLLEGFISNLFIVEHRSGILVVRTALTSVLPGIMQMQVLQACQALQIQLDCTAAKQGDKDLWCEAFLTNTVRGLRPIDKICCLPDNPFGWKPWSCTFVTSPDTSICAKLQRHLDRQDVADVHLV